MFILCCIWFIVAFLWITITSALDKEWMIDGRGINNVCDVLMYLEDDRYP
ncbi:inner membrane protein [Escherichia coli]|uniref:Inner membrane protein n=1 Tax=Escherichia coli TaxID=562 RepID=A0A484YC06_ECOLX|nr:inner membrane protein [Escherichia coli]